MLGSTPGPLFESEPWLLGLIVPGFDSTMIYLFQATAVHILESKAKFMSESELNRNLALVLFVLRIINRWVATKGRRGGDISGGERPRRGKILNFPRRGRDGKKKVKIFLAGEGLARKNLVFRPEEFSPYPALSRHTPQKAVSGKKRRALAYTISRRVILKRYSNPDDENPLDRSL